MSFSQNISWNSSFVGLFISSAQNFLHKKTIIWRQIKWAYDVCLSFFYRLETKIDDYLPRAPIWAHKFNFLIFFLRVFQKKNTSKTIFALLAANLRLQNKIFQFWIQ